MIRIYLQDATVTIDLDNPLVGMADGAVELQSGDTKIPFPFKVISDKPIALDPNVFLDATTKALAESNIALNAVRVYLPTA